MPEMIAIAAATAQIGSPENHLDSVAAAQHYRRAWFEDETPQHQVEFESFALDRTPVTNAEFAQFVEATGHVTSAQRRGYILVYGSAYWTTLDGLDWRHPHPDIDAVTDRPHHPVVHIDHRDATSYAAWAGKRLPTEAEWEYAAHGPNWRPWPWGHEWNEAFANTAEYWAGATIHDLDTWKTWWHDHYRASGPAPATTDVGRFCAGASPLGLLDMAGNITEWTASAYHLYAHPDHYDPVFHTAAEHGYISVRGGSWKSFRWQTRTSERIAVHPGYAAPDLGFRCARDTSETATTTASDNR